MTTTTTTPPPPAYDAVAAISSKTTTTTTTPDDGCVVGVGDAKTNRTKDTADYDDVHSLASLTTRELHRIAISNGDRLGEGPKESTTGGGGGGAAAGNLETNEGGVGLSEAEEKDAKIALCEVRNPKKIGQGNATTTKKFTTTTTTTNVFLSSVKRHVLRASVFDFDATLCGLLLLLLLLTNNCVLLLLLNRLNRVRGVYRQIGMYVSLVQQSERGSRTTIL